MKGLGIVAMLLLAITLVIVVVGCGGEDSTGLDSDGNEVPS